MVACSRATTLILKPRPKREALDSSENSKLKNAFNNYETHISKLKRGSETKSQVFDPATSAPLYPRLRLQGFPSCRASRPAQNRCKPGNALQTYMDIPRNVKGCQLDPDPTRLLRMMLGYIYQAACLYKGLSMWSWHSPKPIPW